MRNPLLPTDATLKTIGMLVGASATVGLLVFLTADAPNASAEVAGAQVQRAAKSERLLASVKGTACSTRGWPHFEQGCLFDDRGSADDVRTVRVIALR